MEKLDSKLVSFLMNKTSSLGTNGLGDVTKSCIFVVKDDHNKS